MKVVVIGGGASGMMAAISVSAREKVILIESNSRVAKKILMTGNGKCNYWNESIDASKYNSCNLSVLTSILQRHEETLNKLFEIGLYPLIKNGYYYPHSGTATTVRSLFEYQIERKKIETRYGFKVESIKKENNQFIIKSTTKEIITADKVIVATGSKASPNTGSDGAGYNFATSFGHQVSPILPSLTPLILKTESRLKWSGVRTKAKIDLLIDSKFIKQEEGELQLHDYGISGVCVFNLSGIVARALYKKKSVKVKINFLPDIVDLETYLINRFNSFADFSIERTLESLMHYEIIFLVVKKAKLKLDALCKDITKEEILKLATIIKEYEFEVEETKDFSRAQVCTGGILLSEINPETMESKIVKNLYFVGEILDADGICGGYNLAFAFITGYLAGKGCTNDSNKSD